MKIWSKRFPPRSGLYWLTAMGLTPTILTAACLLVWPPDLLQPHRRIRLAEISVAQGSLAVEQYWNGIDFYSVELVFSDAHATHRCVLDGDAPKLWRATLTPHPAGDTVQVAYGPFGHGRFSFDPPRFISAAGLERSFTSTHITPEGPESR